MLSADRFSSAVTSAGIWTNAPDAAVATWSIETQLAGGSVASFNLSTTPAGGLQYLELGFAVVFETNASRAVDLAATLATAFPNAWEQALTSWNNTWTAAFTPNNTVFAGHLPTIDVRSVKQHFEDLHFVSRNARRCNVLCRWFLIYLHLLQRCIMLRLCHSCN